MATYESFIGDLSKFSKELGGDGMVVAVGVEAKKIATGQASADLGGDAKFSGWKPTLDTGFDVVGPGTISFKPKNKRSAGPWTVAERGRNGGHKNGKTLGKHTATKAIDKIEAMVPKVVQREFTKVIQNTFGG